MPSDLLSQSFMERPRGRKSQVRACVAGVGRGVACVSGLPGCSAHSELLAGELGDDVQHLVHRRARSAAEVVNRAWYSVPGGRDRPVDRVAYKGEVARLRTIPIDHDLLVFQSRSDEPVECHVRALAWTVNGEVPQCDGR